MKRVWRAVLLLLIVALPALPVLAAPQQQEGGGLHFGAYTLQPGNQVDGDLVVFGGPVSIGAGAELNGDLTVFGPLTMDIDAIVGGQLVVMGSADIDGRVEGDVFSAGALNLRESAYIEGDVATAGSFDSAPGAVVDGVVSPMTEDDWDISLPGPFSFSDDWDRAVEINRTPRWVNVFWNLVRGVIGVVLMSLLALVLASLWPIQVERTGRTIEEAGLTSYGVGLLTLILAGLAAVLLAITICLSPLAFVGLVVVGVGVLLGWVSLGFVLGKRVLAAVFNQSAPSTVTAAILGTALVSFVLALSRTFGLVYTLLLFLLIPPAAGAVVLTRFGSRPYATRGTGGTGSSGPSAGSSSGGPSPRRPAPLPIEPQSEGAAAPATDIGDLGFSDSGIEPLPEDSAVDNEIDVDVDPEEVLLAHA